MEKKLASIYLDPSQPASFGGLDAVYRAVKEKGKNKITRKQVRDWLSQQDVNTLHNSRTVTVGIIHVTIRTDRKDLIWHTVRKGPFTVRKLHLISGT